MAGVECEKLLQTDGLLSIDATNRQLLYTAMHTAGSCKNPVVQFTLLNGKHPHPHSKPGNRNFRLLIKNVFCKHTTRQSGLAVIPDVLFYGQSTIERLVTSALNVNHCAGAGVKVKPLAADILNYKNKLSVFFAKAIVTHSLINKQKKIMTATGAPAELIQIAEEQKLWPNGNVFSFFCECLKNIFTNILHVVTAEKSCSALKKC